MVKYLWLVLALCYHKKDDMVMLKKLTMLFGGVLLAVVAAHAESQPVDGVEWSYEIAEGGATLLGYTQNSHPNAIIIPSSLGGLPVTRIGDSAFFGCTQLQTVWMPDTVASIGAYAFDGCNNLTNIAASSSLTDIGDYAFYNCVKLPDMAIGASVTRIGEAAFSGCAGLTNVTIGASVARIGDSAFIGCNGLTSVTIPDSVTDLGNRAFGDCRSLANVTIGSSVTRIGEAAFAGCAKLTAAALPDSVESIGDSAFSGCFELANVTIGRSVSRIGDYAFKGCRWLKRVSLPDSVKSVGIEAFEGCSVSLFDTKTVPGLKLVDGWIVGNDGVSGDLDLTGRAVRGVGGGGFASCENLTSVTLPDGVVGIGARAFDGCFRLAEVTISDGVESIGASAFSRCYALTEVAIPPSVADVGDYAFANCKRLGTVLAPASLDGAIPATAFSGCPEGLMVLYYSGEMPASGALVPCTVSFDANGSGEAFADKTAYVGYLLDALPVPRRRDGYEFAGWFTAASGGSEVTPETVARGDLALWAHWRELPFVLGGDVEWTEQADGSWRSGAVAYRQTTWVTNSFDGPGVMSFRWKVSSEEFDRLVFYVNGEEQESIGGEQGWTDVSYTAAGDGPWTFKWSYEKDDVTDEGEDCGWLADVAWTPGAGAVFPDAASLAAAFGASSEVARNIGDSSSLAAFNAFLSDCGVTAAGQLTAAQKTWAYRSFRLAEIAAVPALYAAEPELRISRFTRAGANWAATVTLAAGGAGIAMDPAKTQTKLRVGTTPDSLGSAATVVSAPSAPGASLTFTVRMPEGKGFLAVRID